MRGVQDLREGTRRPTEGVPAHGGGRPAAADGGAREASLRRLAILSCRSIPASEGAYDALAEELASRLATLGFAVTVFSPLPPGGEPPREHPGVRREPLPAAARGAAGRLAHDLGALRRARASHDVVLALGYGAGKFLGLARRPGNEVWVHMGGLERLRARWGRLERAWLGSAERAALRRADRVIFDSSAVRSAVVGAETAPRVSVIGHGARLDSEPDLEAPSSLGLRRHGYYLLVTGIEPEDHLQEILAAHARSGSARELVVVGDLAGGGRYGQRCRAAAGREVRFLGTLSDPRILRALRQESAAVLHGDSLGGAQSALLEAMAAGAPVVAHDDPANREVLEERGPFFRDEDELVCALGVVERWTDAERVQRGAANRARIAVRYTWERIAAEYAALLAPQEHGGATERTEVPPALPRPPARQPLRPS